MLFPFTDGYTPGAVVIPKTVVPKLTGRLKGAQKCLLGILVDRKGIQAGPDLHLVDIYHAFSPAR
jgi:hypothetical protein